ncbi:MULTISPECIES: hypothetical protein [unclassified Microcoleus]|uniref:hypothetical protein n=1 Tax=unclassified Microcoleus TaxID=2642155 RepID=UPI002FCFB323
MITLSKAFFELLAVVFGLFVAGVTAAFALATYRYSLALAKLELQIKSNTFESGRKYQQNIDNLKVEMGISKSKIKDLEGAMQKKHHYHPRETISSEYIPPPTKWDVK